GPGGTGAPPGPVAGSADGEVVGGGLVLDDGAGVHLRLAVDGDRERVLARSAVPAADGPAVHLDGVGAGRRLARGPVDVLHAAVVHAVDVRVAVELAAARGRPPVTEVDLVAGRLVDVEVEVGGRAPLERDLHVARAEVAHVGAVGADRALDQTAVVDVDDDEL